MASSPINFRQNSRSSSSNDDIIKDYKTKIRESRWIQPEHWESLEVRDKFLEVKPILFIVAMNIDFDFELSG
jgi:hypothetical protein